MLDEPDTAHSALTHVHVCAHCGGAFRREAFEGRMHDTGIFICPNCGAEGPLNIEIRELDESEAGQMKDK